MGFWFFMTICNLGLPVIMIVMGKVFMKNPPKIINDVYGYRTARSKKNQDTWNYAHLYCGKLWWKTGWIMLPIAVIGMSLVIEKNDDIVGTLGAVIEVIECAALVMTLFCVERTLAEKFDKNGNSIYMSADMETVESTDTGKIR